MIIIKGLKSEDILNEYKQEKKTTTMTTIEWN